jgi:hypothetical protein
MTPDDVEGEVKVRIRSAYMDMTVHDYDSAIEECESAISIMKALKKDIPDDNPDCKFSCSKQIIQLNARAGEPGPYIRTCAFDCQCRNCTMDHGELTHSG